MWYGHKTLGKAEWLKYTKTHHSGFSIYIFKYALNFCIEIIIYSCR